MKILDEIENLAGFELPHVDCSTLGVWLMAKSVPTCIYGALDRVSVLVGDSPDAYTPKTIFYAELAVYVALSNEKRVNKLC